MTNGVEAVSAGLGAPRQATEGPGSLDKNDFMRLLIANLEHQDPLNPTKGTEFATQLAQFSSLEQLMQINSHLIKGVPQADSVAQLSLVNLIGKDVEVNSNTVTIEGGKAPPLAYQLDHAGVVTLRAKTASGKTEADIVIGPKSAGEHTLQLDQIGALSTLADGSYTIELAVTSGVGQSRAIATTQMDRVTGVTLGETPSLLLAGGSVIGIGDLVRVREHVED